MKDDYKAPMEKETVQLEDGRYLIYYSFHNESSDDAVIKDGQASGEDEA